MEVKVARTGTAIGLYTHISGTDRKVCCDIALVGLSPYRAAIRLPGTATYTPKRFRFRQLEKINGRSLVHFSIPSSHASGPF